MIQKCVNHLNAHLLPSNWIAFIKLCDTTNQICFPALELLSVFLNCTNSIWHYNKGKKQKTKKKASVGNCFISKF